MLKKHEKIVKITITFILILCVLGLSMIQQVYCAVTKDVEPCFNGCEACSAKIVSFTDTTLGQTVTPVSCDHDHTMVYLVPNGGNYTISWTANADVLGLAPQQIGTNSFVAGTDCKVNTPCITVSSTVQTART
jgi:hypothetical protein